MWNLVFLFVGLIFITILLTTYFSKQVQNSKENLLFKRLIILNMIGFLVEISLQIIVRCGGIDSKVATIFSYLYLMYIVAWLTYFALYTFIISFDKKNKDSYERKIQTLKKIFLIAMFISFIILFFLPIKKYYNGSEMYTYGLGIDYIFAISGFHFILWILVLVLNLKKIKDKKYFPIFLIILLLTINIILQKYNPSILIATMIHTLVCYTMYFTIENPDMKMVEQLEIAKKAADRANSAKTDFLSSMSHEIRTPLNAIVGFSDCISEAKDLDEAKENAKDIVNASTTLLEIVNGILDISKIEAGKLEIVNSTYNAKELFEGLAKLIKPKMDEKALDFSYYIAPDLPPVLYGDYASIKKVVTNLLSNASKYTDKGFVKYEVNCIRSTDACKLIITVEDSGRGIKKESVDKLFTKFQRVEEDKNTTIEGTGLGLAITKQLVELMGGKIIVHTIYGEGSKFTVVINQKIEKAVVREKVNTVNDNLDLSNTKILIVDDNNLNLKVATKLLERYKANNVECVESGFECLDKVKEGNKYDVILLDDMMPKMSGIETLNKLKEIDGFNIPVVALTANAITGMREKYLNSGFDDYLAKPIEKNDLITVMNRVVNNNETNTGAVVSNNVSKSIPNEEVEEKEDTSDDTGSFDGEKYLRDNGIDMDNALELLGDMEMYNDTLDDYLSEIDSKLEDLKKFKEENNMKEYSVLVHSMKSDAKYLGFMDFADIAYQHELKSKENDSDFVNDNFEKLEEELNKVVKIAKEYKEQV